MFLEKAGEGWKCVIINPSISVCFSSIELLSTAAGTPGDCLRVRTLSRLAGGSGESLDREYSESFTVNQDVCGNFLFFY